MPARQASPPPERPPGGKPSPTAAAPAVTPSSSYEHQESTASSNNDIYQHSNYVYILDAQHSWIPAQVTNRTKSNSNNENDGGSANNQIFHLSVPQYKSEQAIQCDGGRTARSFQKMEINLADPKILAKYPSQHLPLQNVNNEGELQVVEDMVDLPFLHEVSGICVFVIVMEGLLPPKKSDHVLSLVSWMYLPGRHIVQPQIEACRIAAIYSHRRHNSSLQSL